MHMDNENFQLLPHRSQNHDLLTFQIFVSFDDQNSFLVFL